MEQYEALLYFLSGVISYKFLSHVFNVGRTTFIYNEVIKNCLGILHIADETRKLSNNIKYDLLKESGIPILELKSTKESDASVAEFWKTLAIGSLLSLLPRHIVRSLRFKDWDSAMKIIEKEIK